MDLYFESFASTPVYRPDLDYIKDKQLSLQQISPFHTTNIVQGDPTQPVSVGHSFKKK